jgi:hypothetical protein
MWSHGLESNWAHLTFGCRLWRYQHSTFCLLTERLWMPGVQSGRYHQTSSHVVVFAPGLVYIIGLGLGLGLLGSGQLTISLHSVVS